jgi:hypothetical protein
MVAPHCRLTNVTAELSQRCEQATYALRRHSHRAAPDLLDAHPGRSPVAAGVSI